MAYFTASCDPADKNTEFAKSIELDYPILSDPGTDIAKAYGAFNSERKMALRWTFYIGKDGKILLIDKDVKPGNHGADIAAKLKELGVAEKK